MQKNERLDAILRQLKTDRKIYVTRLSELLNVSDDTIRRDLAELEERGLLTKIHGGAVTRSGISLEFNERLQSDMNEKHSLAMKVVTLLDDGAVILMDGGTTNLEIARCLPEDKKFKVFTNALPTAMELALRQNVETYLFGGKIIGPSRVTSGVSAYEEIKDIYPDWTIIGVSDIHPEKGLMTTMREESVIKRAMLEQGGKRMIVATSNKLGTAHNYRFGSLSDIDYLVVEDDKKQVIQSSWPQSHYTLI